MSFLNRLAKFLGLKKDSPVKVVLKPTFKPTVPPHFHTWIPIRVYLSENKFKMMLMCKDCKELHE